MCLHLAKFKVSRVVIFNISLDYYAVDNQYTSKAEMIIFGSGLDNTIMSPPMQVASCK